MTSIEFYPRVNDRVAFAVQLVAKAYARHGSVRVLTQDAAMTEALDRRLWLDPPTGFLPHCRLDSPLAGETPILVDHALAHEGAAAMLVNLHPSPPPFFGRFERMAEIVGASDEETAAGRVRYRFYRERGYELRTHDASDRGG